MSYRRQDPDRFYAYPEHKAMLPFGWWHRLLWKLGFDPLSDRRRATQLQRENADWKRWTETAELNAGRYHEALEKIERTGMSVIAADLRIIAREALEAEADDD